MNFKEFWKKLQTKLKTEQKFTTLVRHMTFKAYFSNNLVYVTPTSSMIQRGPIPSNEFEGIWNNTKDYLPETRFKNKDGRLNSYITQKGKQGKSMQNSYIIALIKYIVKEQNME